MQNVILLQKIKAEDALYSLKEQIDNLRLTEDEREAMRTNIFDLEDVIEFLTKEVKTE